jgi:uncharacterized membrane protein YeaQ/YmgE (transglycosylase-associated protein family)
MSEAGIGWIAAIIIGGLAGWLAEMFMKSGTGILMNIILGIVGAIVGGWVFSLVGGHGVTGFNVYSLIVAVIGSIIVLVVYHALFRRKT